MNFLYSDFQQSPYGQRFIFTMHLINNYNVFKRNIESLYVLVNAFLQLIHIVVDTNINIEKIEH